MIFKLNQHTSIKRMSKDAFVMQTGLKMSVMIKFYLCELRLRTTFRKNLVVKENVQFSVEIGDILHELQSERGTSAFFISTHGDEEYHDKLKEQFIETDEAIINLSKWVPSNNVIRINSRQEFIDYLWEFRTDLLKDYVNLTEMISFYSTVNYLLESAMVRSMNMEVAYTYWSELIAYEMLLFSKEHASIERALGGTYYTKGKLPKQYYIWYIETRRLSKEFLSQSIWYSTFAKTVITSLYNDNGLSDSLERMRQEITSNRLRNSSLEAGNDWFDNMTAFIDILKIVQDGFAFNINQHVSDENNSLEEKLAAKSVQLVVAISMLPIVALLVRGIVKVSIELRNRTLDLESKKRQTDRLLIELEDERARTENLLHQVLPQSIAKTLIEKGHVVPEAFESATIMFTDVVDFTTISSMCTPIEVISMLNKLYSTMDERVEIYDVYKVETIGDAYMVTSGLPNRNGGQHVTEIAQLSLELRDALNKIMVPHRKNETIRLRIGFNTGPCAAGVVGHKMPKYCVFGDTVNTASRMESTSLR
ncbi:hypothetical protein ACF0H5_009166 [Mactra antiquata]